MGFGMVDAAMREVLGAWDWPEQVRADDADGGLINKTWWVRGAGGTHAVLQQLNTRIFRPEVHEDIEAVTSRVAAAGLVTPRLVRTRTGGLWHVGPEAGTTGATGADGAVYRCLTVVGARTVHKLDGPDRQADARSAARFVARFHAAVQGLDWSFKMVRPGVHDTVAHFQRLRDAIDTYRSHRLYAEVAPLAERILGGWAPSPGAPLPTRVLHGDLKISNVRFVGSEAVALVDLDTFQRGTLDIELGDAMRSWCNPVAESDPDARVEVDLFEAAMVGYAEGARASGLSSSAMSDAEWDAVVPGIERVALELASRFAQDALAETYFGFDPKYGGRGEHNLVRARGQVALANSVSARRDELVQAVARARRLS
ncbi:MAG: phosphotransferase [Myxococcota bacterium]